MRFLSKASTFAALGFFAYYLIYALPLVNQDAAHFGAGYFWAWLTVTLPITVRFWTFPLTFGSKAFKIIYAASFIESTDPDVQEPATGRRIAAVLTMMAGFFTAGQVSLHFVIDPAMNAFLDKASTGDAGGAALLALWCYVLYFLAVQLLFPWVMALFMFAAKAMAPEAAKFLAYTWRGYIRGIYPFMSWVFQ